MFISVFDIFKIGLGPSSSHTSAPMDASRKFLNLACRYINSQDDKSNNFKIQCVLKGSLGWTGKNHESDKAIILGLNDYSPKSLVNVDIESLFQKLKYKKQISFDGFIFDFDFDEDIIFDKSEALKEHPNGMIFSLFFQNKKVLEQIYFSIGGGFVKTKEEMYDNKKESLDEKINKTKYPFCNASSMLEMAKANDISIAKMKRENELLFFDNATIDKKLDDIWDMMEASVSRGLNASGVLKGDIKLNKRAKKIYEKIKIQEKQTGETGSWNDYLSAYAISVNEENASSNIIVTSPTNGASGVIPALLYYMVHHKNINQNQIRDFLLTAGAIGGIIKYCASISGAEVGCQGEIGSASAMGAAGLCAINGGSINQVENASEIALEHHLGMTCDPVDGLVQVPCIERNAFGAIKAYSASSLALFEDGRHFVSLDNCISSMKEIGLDMHHKYKETSLGGLAINTTWC